MSNDRYGCLVIIALFALGLGAVLTLIYIGNIHDIAELRAYHPQYTLRNHFIWGIQVKLNDGWVDWKVYQEKGGGSAQD